MLAEGRGEDTVVPALTWVSVCCHETTTPGAVLHQKTSIDTVLKACCIQWPKSAAKSQLNCCENESDQLPLYLWRKVMLNWSQVCLPLESSNNTKCKRVERLSIFRAKSEWFYPGCHQYVRKTRTRQMLCLPAVFCSQVAPRGPEMPVKINGVTVTAISSILDIAELYLWILHMSYRNKPKPHKHSQLLFSRWIYPLEVDSSF